MSVLGNIINLLLNSSGFLRNIPNDLLMLRNNRQLERLNLVVGFLFQSSLLLLLLLLQEQLLFPLLLLLRLL